MHLMDVLGLKGKTCSLTYADGSNHVGEISTVNLGKGQVHIKLGSKPPTYKWLSLDSIVSAQPIV